MATVYLARDLRHDRPVALKVLRPELAASLGPERFLREIRIAARLRHPHILPVHDSGEAAGRLWYTMPYVEGESLRQRLAREGQLPLDQAVGIATQVLSALGHAHSQGVVHRDIKPENILLGGDQAVVTDFGVARAMAAAGEERLTETGLALGTPSYMSPEQATGSGELDARSDLYAVGCVLYETLAGRPPFHGTNAQQLLARHAIDPAPPLRTVRDTVPEGVERSVMRALAKAPADRFPTAASFAEALIAPAPTSARPRRWRPAGLAAAGLALGVALAVALAVAAYFRRPHPAAALDPNLVAVVPFRVSGAAPALGYLREGMIDLVAARMIGEGSARAADPRSVMNAWRRAAGAVADDLPERDALGLARGLGAGQLLLGGVVGTPEHVSLTASLIPVRGRGARAQARVEGAADSLPRLVDRLIAQLITEGARASHALDGFADTPLPALQLYLEGQAAQRRAEYAEAAAGFGRALDLDSTFAVAGMALAGAAAWTANPGAARRGLERAWAGRARLSPADKALVLAETGPGYPATSTLVQYLDAWERAVDAAPDQADRWYELGDVYFHDGAYLQLESARRRAGEAFRRSVALDSNTSALGHLLEVAVLDRDTSAVRRLGSLYLARDTSGELLGFYRWRIAEGLRDDRALAALRAEYRRMPLPSLWRIMNHAVLDGRLLDDADSAAAAIRAAAGRSADWQRSKTYLHAFEVNRGRPAAALADTAGSDEAEYGPHAALYQRVLDALYGDGDSADGGRAARELARIGSGEREVARTDLCVTTLWRLSHGEAGGALRAIERLRNRAPGDSPQSVTGSFLCAALLEAKLGAPGALDRLDALMRSGPSGQRNGPPVAFTLSPAFVRSTVGISPCGFEDFANLEVARLRERQGDRRGALAAVRRRPYAYHLSDYLAPHLREQGRLAALTGDTAGAVGAYRHYLALRSDTEPSLRPGVDSVRTELARLEGEAVP
jgi:serine/threonine-protein kinase